MSRRIARELAVQGLFQIDFNECEANAALEAALEVREENVRETVKEYALTLINGVLEHKEEIDERLSKYAIDWSVERMPATDRNILRIAVYEMFLANEKVAIGVTINEAVEIAKVFGTEESARFVNGVLGKLAKE